MPLEVRDLSTGKRLLVVPGPMSTLHVLSTPDGRYLLAAGASGAIDVHEGEKINEKALKALVRQAVAMNAAVAKQAKVAKRKK